jgi:hypothetical protein
MKQLAPLLALAVAVAACGRDGAAGGSSGIRGRALAGPQCPVEVEGSPCPDLPWVGVVIATDAASGKEFTAETDVEGRFELVLAPGTYEVTIKSGTMLPTAKPQTVTVEAGAFTRVVVSVDTGIR